MRVDEGIAAALAAGTSGVHDHGCYSVEDWLTLPETNHRVELIDGCFVISPPPGAPHQGSAAILVRILQDAAPDDIEVLTAVGVRCGDHGLIPDVVVALGEASFKSDDWLAAEIVRAIVEIVSPGSKMRDYRDKPHIYAAAGIPIFIRIEMRGPRTPQVEVLTLRDRAYVTTAMRSAGEMLNLSEPFEVSFDPARLAGPFGKQ